MFNKKPLADNTRRPSTGAQAKIYSRDNVARYSERARQRRRGRTVRRVALIAVLGVLLSATTAAGLWFATIMGKLGDSNVITNNLRQILVDTDEAKDPFYVLLLGTDGRPGEDTYRADSIILARIDPTQKQATLISIPRDTKVVYKGSTMKINACHTYGGAEAMVQAVNELCGVQIAHYAEVSFDGMQSLIDSVGGIDINVQYEINDPNYMGYLAAGQQTLNGEQALIYCRSRHAYDAIGDGDAIRSANQRTMISAIMKKLMSSDIGTLTNTVSTLAQYITTDYSVADILGLAQRMFGIDIDKNVYSAAVPTTSSYENDVWYEKVNTSEWNKMMSRVKQGLSPTEGDVTDETTGTVMASSGSGGSGSGDSGSGGASGSSLSGTKISVKNGNGTQGCASDAAAKLTPQGAVCETGNADDSNYAKTLVIYDGDNADKAQKVADLLGCGTVMKNDGRYTYTGDILVVVGQDWK